MYLTGNLPLCIIHTGTCLLCPLYMTAIYIETNAIVQKILRSYIGFSMDTRDP